LFFLFLFLFSRSANLPEGLYILPMFFLYFFLYFLMVDFLAPCSSDTYRAIFTKISGLVDGYKGLLTSLSFFDFSRDVAMATKVEKSAFFTDQFTLSLCHSETE